MLFMRYCRFDITSFHRLSHCEPTPVTKTRWCEGSGILDEGHLPPFFSLLSCFRLIEGV